MLFMTELKKLPMKAKLTKKEQELLWEKMVADAKVAFEKKYGMTDREMHDLIQDKARNARISWELEKK